MKVIVMVIVAFITGYMAVVYATTNNPQMPLPDVTVNENGEINWIPPIGFKSVGKNCFEKIIGRDKFTYCFGEVAVHLPYFEDVYIGQWKGDSHLYKILYNDNGNYVRGSNFNEWYKETEQRGCEGRRSKSFDYSSVSAIPSRYAMVSFTGTKLIEIKCPRSAVKSGLPVPQYILEDYFQRVHPRIYLDIFAARLPDDRPIAKYADAGCAEVDFYPKGATNAVITYCDFVFD